MDMKCNFFGEAFRYVFFVVEDTWTSNNQGWMYPNGCEENLMEYITFDELEVFVKKEK